MVIFLDKSLIPGKIMAAGLVSMNRGPCFIQAGGEMRTKNLVKVPCLLNIVQLGSLLLKIGAPVTLFLRSPSWLHGSYYGLEEK